jgi:hypothetical protein
MGRNVALTREMRNAFEILVEKSDGKKPFGGSRHRWKDNIKVDLMDTQLEGLN